MIGLIGFLQQDFCDSVGRAWLGGSVVEGEEKYLIELSTTTTLYETVHWGKSVCCSKHDSGLFDSAPNV